MNLTEKVSFGNEMVDPLYYMDTTGVSGLIPDAAFTDELTIETNDGVLELGEYNIILDSASQVVVSGFSSEFVSGAPGDMVEITGENFYQITDVNFGTGIGKSSQFNVLSDNVIETIVPSGAAYDSVTVFSSLRTGANGNQSFASGKTYNEFLPIPSVSGMNSGQLKKGEEFILGGVAMSGVTGLQVNNIEFDSFVSLGSTGVKANVPTGNVRGTPELLLQSGQKVSAPSNFKFKPLAEIVGVTPGKATGQLVTISGNNFSSGLFYTGLGSLTGSLVSIGGETGNFKLISDAGGYNRLQGMLPTGFPLILTGGNVSVAPTILPQAVHIFSNDYPEEYPSNATFRANITNPTITGVVPKSGVGGRLITIEGDNLYGITGVDFGGGNVGIGTEYASTNIVHGAKGKSIDVIVPDTSNFAANGGFLEISVSGFFGNVGIGEGYFVLGTPNVDKVIPDTNVLPGSTGTIYGSRLYSGSKVRLYNTNAAPANFRSNIEVSGYSLNHDEIIFYYPNTFETGNNYKLRVTNDRASSTISDGAFTSKYSPAISGVSLVSGDYGDSVTVSGYFEGIKPSGLRVGGRIIEDRSFTQVSTTGIMFDIPRYSTSDIIKIDTSGGYTQTTGLLNVAPSKPSISGYYLGLDEKPDEFNSLQVFKEGDELSLSGYGMNLVTGVLFSGSSGTFAINNFTQQTASVLSFSVPENINSGSGQFILQDFKSRRTESPYNINITTISGYTEYLIPGEALQLSGANVTGLDINFPCLGSTGYKVAAGNAYSITESGLGLISAQMPSGIVSMADYGVSRGGYGLILTGRENFNASEGFSFKQLGVISGVTGFDSNRKVETGNIIGVSGINVDIQYSGQRYNYFMGISGTGNNESVNEIHLYELKSDDGMQITGSGIGNNPNLPYVKYEFKPDNAFIGTGKLFIVNAWDGSVGAEGALSSGSLNNIPKQVSVFPDEYIITGTRVSATGYGPKRGVTGQNVSITGEGLRAVTGVYFNVPSGIQLLADFTINSPNKITATVPDEAIEARGMTNILLSGGTNYNVGDFEIILNASVVEFDIVDEDDIPTSSSRVGNFTQKETIGGVVYLVTRTRFPDGTTAIVSSTPEA